MAEGYGQDRVKAAIPVALNVLVLGDLAEDSLRRLAQRHRIMIWNDQIEAPPRDIVASVDIVIIRSPHKVSSAFLSTASRLRWIIRAGSGTDNIDVTAAHERGIQIYTTPNSAPSVAELAFALLLAVARQIPSCHCAMQQGKWGKSSVRGIELSGKTIAIVGLGRVGRHVAKIASGFSMHVIAVDRSMHKPEKVKCLQSLSGVRIASLEQALPEANVLVLCCPYSPETMNMIDAGRLALLPRGAIVINVARGGIIDRNALLQALNSGHLAGAGLDAFELEPPGKDPLFQLPQVVATPHIGAQTGETFVRIGREVESLLKKEILGKGNINPSFTC